MSQTIIKKLLTYYFLIMNTKKIIIGLIMLIIIIVSLILTINPKKNRPSPEQETITIGMVTFPGYAPLFIAKEKGFYGNTNVKLVFIESLGDLRSALQTGTIDAYEMTYDMFQSVKDIAPDAVAFLATDDSQGADGIVAPKTITKPADLKGKMVGIEPGFPAYLALLSYLHQGGLTLADVNFKDIPTKDVPAAYLSKSVVVAGAYEPYLSELLSKSKDSHMLISTKETPGLAMEFMWVTPKTLNEKHDALVDVAQGYFKAVELIKSNPIDAFATAAPTFGISTEEMASFQEGIIWPDLAHNRKLLGQNVTADSATKMFAYVGGVLRENNETNLTLNPADHITDIIIKAVK